jgi:hypothetical protein
MSAYNQKHRNKIEKTRKAKRGNVLKNPLIAEVISKLSAKNETMPDIAMPTINVP